MNKPLTKKEKIQMEMLQHVLDHMWDSSVYCIRTESEVRQEALHELLDNGYLSHEVSMKDTTHIVYVITSAGERYLKELKERLKAENS